MRRSGPPETPPPGPPRPARRTLTDRREPVPQLQRLGEASLEADVSELPQTRQLAHVRRVRAFAVVDDIGGGLADRDLGEPGKLDTLDLHPEAEIPIGVA